MSEVKVNKISPRTNCGTVTVGDSGDSVSVSAGVPVTVNGDLKSNALKATDGGSIISQSGTTITLGASGDTVSLASGASQTGFGRAGSVDWQTGDIKTATFTASDGEGYFCNTTSSAFTVNLPAGSAGAIVSINDYANTAATNNITIASNGSEKINGLTDNYLIQTNGVTGTFVYVDGTQGWKIVDTGDSSDVPPVASFTTATGGTITTCGDYKIHSFCSPGTFCVSAVGNGPSNPAGGPNTVSYMVVAGGGGGGIINGAGGGAGGFREGKDIGPSYSASPLAATSNLTLSIQGYPITVGAGGASKPYSPTDGGGAPFGNPGSNSVFSTITSAGGGGGGSNGAGKPGDSGGSGGGGCDNAPGASGNTPPVSPPQGQDGGGSNNPSNGGGGGGAGAAGSTANVSCRGGNGGNGVATSITGSPATRAGGGGGGGRPGGSPVTPQGGSGGGGNGNNGGSGSNGSANTGGGGGSTGNAAPLSSGAGGSGTVVIRYKFQ